MNMPKHIAMIMDGNGRWAKAQGKKRTQGHKEGAKIVRDVTQWCANKHIPYLTLYAFSTENWKRPKIEVDFLMNLLEKYLHNEQPMYMKNHIRFRAIGDISIFSTTLKNAILELEHITQNHTNLTQILALNYGSHDEIARTFIKLANTLSPTHLAALSTSEVIDMINANLDTATLPDVDMLIRTGGEKRISNFLLWQASYAELFFTSTLWPNLRTQELDSMLEDFMQRKRRFGGL
ncbi:di-trans,poly-cis-decaprenylcistransferase [Helicobacter jaachi]|uniref:Isoprenyl transferase n=1 Tax=Helicobacter jaachi TaxID=1677920 RepID=A0A4U8T970_9HELI|nr:di-trans,poly-cis-decaprenylcistransferase [Helicobacter jaachi]TLD96301.1 di-trans,poly-cis-decaprenylcistransferase [Helicobacter jaachi]